MANMTVKRASGEDSTVVGSGTFEESIKAVLLRKTRQQVIDLYHEVDVLYTRLFDLSLQRDELLRVVRKVIGQLDTQPSGQPDPASEARDSLLSAVLYCTESTPKERVLDSVTRIAGGQ